MPYCGLYSNIQTTDLPLQELIPRIHTSQFKLWTKILVWTVLYCTTRSGINYNTTVYCMYSPAPYYLCRCSPRRQLWAPPTRLWCSATGGPALAPLPRAGGPSGPASPGSAASSPDALCSGDCEFRERHTWYSTVQYSRLIGWLVVWSRVNQVIWNNGEC